MMPESLLPVCVSQAFGPLLDHLHQQVISQRPHPPGNLDIHLQPSPLSGYGSSVRMGSGPTAEIAQKRAECLLHFGGLAAVPAEMGLQVLLPVVAAQFALGLRDEIEHAKPGAMAEVVRRNSSQPHPAICHSHDFCDANVVMAEVITGWIGVEPTAEGVSENAGVMALWNQSWALAKASFFGDLPAAHDVCVSVSQTGQLPQKWQVPDHQDSAELPEDDAPSAPVG